MTPARRLAVLGLLAAVLAAGFAADRIGRPEPRPDMTVALANRMPTAAPFRALASTWFCAGGTGKPGSDADAVVMIANSRTEPVKASITVVGSEGDPASLAFDVPARGRSRIRLGDLLAAPFVAATVDVSSGGVAVEQQVSGPSGFSAAPCASSGSDRWHLADGSTAREDTMLVALYNPFPEDAIVDFSFSTDEGRAVPSNLQGVVVRGGGLRVVNVGDHVRRRNRVAATLVTRAGRVVADRLQFKGGSPRGMTIGLLSPSSGTEWWFPEGYVADGVFERFSIYNPSSREAVVSVELVLDQDSAEPFDLTIAPGERVDLNAHDEDRVPRGVGHAAFVRSENGVGVVAERTVVATAPSGRSGISIAPGARRTAATWLTAVGAANDRVDQWITVLNPGDTAVQLSVTVLAAGQPLAIEGLQDVEVPAGQRRAFRLTDMIKRDDLPLRIDATGGDVVVERAIYTVGSAGVAMSAAIPLR